MIVGTHLDKIKGDLEKERRKQEVIAFIQEKYPFEGNTQHLKELGLPNIKDVLFVGCPSNGRSEGVSELRQALYDIAFSLTVPQRRGEQLNVPPFLPMITAQVQCVHVNITVHFTCVHLIDTHVHCFTCMLFLPLLFLLHRHG